MPEKNHKGLLGIDAGSVCLKITWKQNGHLTHLRREHFGEPLPALKQLLEDHHISFSDHRSVLTGRYADILSHHLNIPKVSQVGCLISTWEEQGANIRYLVDIGSSGLSMTEIQDGKFQSYQTNSLCAAGTGAFLDQQMKRMGLDYEKIQRIPIIDNPPDIASRCAVFAKSDLIHRQQQGYTVEQLWNGLVKGLAASAYSTLFRGKTLQHDVFLIGGLANNKIFLHFFSKLLNGRRLVVAPCPDFFWTQSLVKHLLQEKSGQSVNGIDHSLAPASFEKPLAFEGIKAAPHLHYTDGYGNEADVWHLDKGRTYEVFAGLDIGSTSTKIALLDTAGTVLAGLYTRTAGKPLEAFRTILKGIQGLEKQHGVAFTIKALGTTGSGRNLLGHFAGADLVKNEITAHLKGAVKEFPEVNTIFEIGGQDSKYIQVEDQWMKDANMNYVCAAGTGSFLEEQARNLNIPLDDIPGVCRGALPPTSSDRCTVFMEQDANHLLSKGHTRSQVMASILYSVCRNYLNRVVHNRPIAEPILFLGATAKNRGLVEAFGHVLGKEVHTSQYSHLMGAIGMAEMLRQNPPLKTAFKGFGLISQQVSLREETCQVCSNHCRITYMQGGDGTTTTSWGYLCGKEPGEPSVRKSNHLEAMNHYNRIMEPRQPIIQGATTLYLPRGLQHFTFNVFWKRLCRELNINLQTTGATSDEIMRLARSSSLTDCCFPMKLAIGHVIHAHRKEQAPLLVPFHIQDTANPRADNSYFCPLSQAYPAILKSTLVYNGIAHDQLLMPVIDFSKEADYNVENLLQALQPLMPRLNAGQLTKAYLAALQEHRQHLEELRNYGKQFLEEKGTDNRPVFVIMGRSYNLLDKSLNLGIIASIARYGYRVIPMDMLPLERNELPDGYRDMYWSYGQKIVLAARYIASQPNLYPVFLTNFNCGPDSFLLTTFEKLLRNKPYLILELDEHGGDAGYLTRLEAFFDRTNHHFGNRKETLPLKEAPSHIVPSFKGHRVYLPPMHPFGARLVGAALRANGIDAVPLQKEDAETFSLGRSHVRGSECMPAASTIGAFLHQVSQEKSSESTSKALLMPCTSGPCRFGQYARLHDQILQKLDIEAKIISPNSDDNYQDVKGRTRIQILKGLVLADLMLKLGCRLRPYEQQKGETDRLIEQATRELEKNLENKKSVMSVLRKLNRQVEGIALNHTNKPLVGVVGEIYVRNSPFSNSNLIRKIESSGGEAWMAPMMEWLHYAAHLKKTSNVFDELLRQFSIQFTHRFEKRYYNVFKRFLHDRQEPATPDIISYGRTYLPPEVEGESILTIGRAVGFIKQQVSLVVNVSPFGCMPGSISSAILRNVSREYNTPVVSVFYDGETDFDELIASYILNSSGTKPPSDVLHQPH